MIQEQKEKQITWEALIFIGAMYLELPNFFFSSKTGGLYKGASWE